MAIDIKILNAHLFDPTIPFLGTHNKMIRLMYKDVVQELVTDKKLEAI